MQINNLPQLRFSITRTGNESHYGLNFGQGRLSPRMTTYSQLIEKHTSELRRNTRAASQHQVIRNHLGALRAFLRTAYKSEHSVVGPELADEFTQKLHQHLASSGLSDRSKADRKSLLNAWKSTYEGLAPRGDTAPTKRERRSADAHGSSQNPFEIELKRALQDAGLSAKSAARLAGVSTSAVGRWNRGALPNVRSKESVGKLEAVLKVPSNTLLDKLDGCLASNVPAPVKAYRDRVKAMSKLEFHLKVSELSSGFLQEWNELLVYKTAVRPVNGLKRSKGGAWSVAQPEHSAIHPSPINSVTGGIVHTASLNWGKVSAFLGFLRLPIHEGGLGQEPSRIQTLAWLCVPEAIEAYLQFATQRSGGLKHEGHRSFSNLVASLSREKYGYLRQSSDFISRLPSDVVAGRTWDFLCDEAHATAEAWASVAADTARNPNEGIAYFLEQAQPLRPIFDAMRRMRRVADGCMPGSVSEAVLRRDEVLLGFFTSNPLRVKNVKTLTWTADNRGHLYKTSTGQWRLRIQAREFKNRGGNKNKKRKVYDVAVAPWLTPTLEEYLERHRPVLCQASPASQFLFPNSLTGERMDDMSRRVFDVTKRFIPQSGGISPHAFRHLIATAWLEEHPNDFYVVAELLNDTLQVVLNTYSHLKKDTSFSKYEGFVSAML